MRQGEKSTRFFAKAVLILSALALILVAAYVVGTRWERRGAATQRGSLEGRFEEARVVDYHGTPYRYRKQDLTTVLFMGIDTLSEQPVSGIGFRDGGQSDFLLLMVIDHKQKKITPIHIDRDTMTPIVVLSVLGKEVGTIQAQICLSHGFGDGKAWSCELTMRAVSMMLLGVDVDYYVAMNLDSIPTLNDALGGVTVTLEDDFSMLDPTMTKGATLTLHGKQAEYYVRNRMQIGVGTNEARMVRQRDYMDKLSHVLNEKTRNNADYIGELFDLLEPSIFTNMKRGRMINEVWNDRDYERCDTVSPAGEHIAGDNGFMEFYADQAALEELVLGLFFEPAN